MKQNRPLSSAIKLIELIEKGELPVDRLRPRETKIIVEKPFDQGFGHKKVAKLRLDIPKDVVFIMVILIYGKGGDITFWIVRYPTLTAIRRRLRAFHTKKSPSPH